MGRAAAECRVRLSIALAHAALVAAAGCFAGCALRLNPRWLAPRSVTFPTPTRALLLPLRRSYLVIFGSFAVSTFLLTLYFAKRTKAAAAAFLLLRPLGPGISLLLLGTSDLKLPQWQALTQIGAVLIFTLGAAHIGWHAAQLCGWQLPSHGSQCMERCRGGGGAIGSGGAAHGGGPGQPWRGAIRSFSGSKRGYENVGEGGGADGTSANGGGLGYEDRNGYLSGLLERAGADGEVEFAQLGPLRAPPNPPNPIFVDRAASGTLPVAREADGPIHAGGLPLDAPPAHMPAHVRVAMAAEGGRTPLEELGASKAEDALRDAAAQSNHALAQLARAQHELVSTIGSMAAELADLRRQVAGGVGARRPSLPSGGNVRSPSHGGAQQGGVWGSHAPVQAVPDSEAQQAGEHGRRETNQGNHCQVSVSPLETIEGSVAAGHGGGGALAAAQHMVVGNSANLL